MNNNLYSCKSLSFKPEGNFRYHKLYQLGSNQENIAYPSGLCAERTTLFYANSQYPDIAIKALAIAACDKNGTPSANIISPCGACRQVMLETENRFGKPIRILLYGNKEVYVIESVTSLLPLAFSDLY